MKVLVLSNRVPFIRGGAEELSFHLVKRLRDAGHSAEEMRIPFSWQPAERLIEEMVIARSIRIANTDRVIALKFPTYLIPHDNQVIWLLHQFRQAYDLFDAGQSDIGHDQRGDVIRAAIRAADEEAFRSTRALFAISNAAKRLQSYHSIIANVLSAPLNDPELFGGGESCSFVLAAGRVGAAKRQALLIEAMRYAPRAKLVVAGPPESSQVVSELTALCDRCGVTDRVTFHLRFLPRTELATLVNTCSAVAYIPFDEDSAGYVTLEAYHAGKPVITTTDAGGVLEMVIDGESGLVVEPNAQHLGGAISQIINDRTLAKRMGGAGRDALLALDLTWPKTLAKLLA